jgi:PAS domain S-box-containing protein
MTKKNTAPFLAVPMAAIHSPSVTERRKSDSSLFSTVALQSAIFNSANFSSIATDAKGVIQIFNVGAERMLGYAAADVVNQISPADISDPQEVIARARTLSAELDTPITPGFEALVFKASRGIEDIYELTYIRKDGSRFPAVVSVTALRDAEDAIIGYLLIGTDNTARKLIEEEQEKLDQRLRDQQFYTRSLIESNIDAIMTTDPAGIITDVNKQMEALTDCTRDELIGAPLKKYFTDPERAVAAMTSVLSGKKITNYELTVRARNGIETVVSYNATTFYDRDRVLQGVFAAARDVTESKRLDQVLQEKNIELESARLVADKANLAKSDFLSSMSHEIRTPMNGVIAMVDILQETKLEPTQHRMLNTIQRSAQTLLNILNDILDFSKIEAGKLDIERLPTHLRELTEGVALLMVATSAAKLIELAVYVSPALPHHILTDPTRLRQILLNLLGNAIKFTSSQEGKQAQVTLYVEPCTLAEGQPGVIFRVVDNGIGMSTEAQLRLFQPFTQADESTARKFGGTGLGLSISQRLVEMMDGHISVRSTEGQGSEFMIELPLQNATTPGMQVFGPSLTGVHVLTVNHDAALHRVVRSYCLDADAEVTAFEDLDAVRHHLTQLPPDVGPMVVLLGIDVQGANVDLDLPAAAGIVCLERFVGTTVLGAFGVSAFPLHYSYLIEAIAFASGRLIRSSTELSRRRGAQTSPTPPTIEQAVATRRLILLAEDNDTNRDVMQLQLRLLGHACEVAEDGAVALEMWRTGRYSLLLTDCHMARMDGFALTAAIRENEPYGTHLPIVAITANAMQGESERCLARGMDDYLSKPTRMEDLAPVLDKWLPRENAGASPYPITPRALNTSAVAVLWDSETLGKMVGDDLALQRSVLEKFLLGAENRILTIVRATSDAEFETAAEVAHTLKSSARMVGAFQLGELSEAMETAGGGENGPTCLALAGTLTSVFASTRNKIRAHISAQI